MNTRPTWLPELLSLDGSWENALNLLYDIFTIDIKNGKLSLNGFSIWWDRKILPGERYEEAFWHLITRDSLESRIPNYERAKRLTWFAPVIRRTGHDSAVRCWEASEAQRVTAYVWLYEWDYVIIFDKRQQRKGMIYFLVTAHIVEPHKKKKLEKSYREAISK